MRDWPIVTLDFWIQTIGMGWQQELRLTRRFEWSFLPSKFAFKFKPRSSQKVLLRSNGQGQFWAFLFSNAQQFPIGGLLDVKRYTQHNHMMLSKQRRWDNWRSVEAAQRSDAFSENKLIQTVIHIQRFVWSPRHNETIKALHPSTSHPTLTWDNKNIGFFSSDIHETKYLAWVLLVA